MWFRWCLKGIAACDQSQPNAFWRAPAATRFQAEVAGQEAHTVTLLTFGDAFRGAATGCYKRP